MQSQDAELQKEKQRVFEEEEARVKRNMPQVKMRVKDIKLPPKQAAEYNYLRSRGYSKSRALQKLLEL